jgi:hypothetical protein
MTSFGPHNIFILINIIMVLFSSSDRLISDSRLKQEADTVENKARYFLHKFVQSMLPTFGIAAK